MILIISLLIAVVITAAIGAVILMVIAPFTANRKPDFQEAFKAMFIAYICQFLAGLILGFFMIDADPAITQIVGAGVGFVVLTIVLGYTIEATVPRAALTAIVLIGLSTLVGMAWNAITGSGDDSISALPNFQSLTHLA